MFAPGEIVYGWAKILYKPKNKYTVSIYRDENLNILAQFTTSQNRVGYVFEAGQIIGTNPETNQPFAFPKRTTIAFDYGFLFGDEQRLINSFDNPVVVAKLSDDIYINLVYALYSNPDFPDKYRGCLEKVLEDWYK